jgi:hypothetical protein
MAWSSFRSRVWGGLWAGLGPSAVAQTPVSAPVLPALGFLFSSAVTATSLAFVVQNLTTGVTVPGTTTYNASTHLATWTAAAPTPLLRGVKYLVTVSGATAADGTPMVPVEFPFTLGVPANNRYFAGLRWARRSA